VLLKHKKKGGLSMVTKTVAIYAFFDDILKSMGDKEPINRKVTDAEVITVILLSACYSDGNIETGINFVRTTGMMPRMLSKSRFNRRSFLCSTTCFIVLLKNYCKFTVGM
jgi:hypothetical protein